MNDPRSLPSPTPSLVPPNSVCLLELTQPQASCLFALLTRMQGIRGSKQTHRSRLLNTLHIQLKEFEEARLDLIKQHGKKDEKGELAAPVRHPNGTEAYDLENKPAFDEAFTALLKDLPIIVDGRSDQLVNMALGVVYDLLQSDECPQLMPLRPNQPVNEFEGMLLVQVIDAFKFTPAPK